MCQAGDNLSQFHGPYTVLISMISLYIIQPRLPCWPLVRGQKEAPKLSSVGYITPPTYIFSSFFFFPSLQGNPLTCGLRPREKPVVISSFLAATGDLRAPSPRLSCSVRCFYYYYYYFFFLLQRNTQTKCRSWGWCWNLSRLTWGSGCC